jgi:hypothetical protein
MPSPNRPRLLLLAASAVLVTAPASQAAFVPLQNATATFSQSGFLANQTIDGILVGNNGWAISDQIVNQTIVWETQANLGFVGGTALTFTLQQLFAPTTNPQHTLGKFRLSATTDARSDFADGLQSGGDVSATWVTLAPTSVSATNGTLLTVQGDQSILASGPNPAISVYTVSATTFLTGITGFRL